MKQSDKRFHTIDGETLMSQPLQPLNFVVDSLLSRGLHILSRSEFIGTPTELSQKIDPDGREGITPKKVSRMILQSVDALSKNGILVSVRRSNGKRIIELRRAYSDDSQGAPKSTLATLFPPVSRFERLCRAGGVTTRPREINGAEAGFTPKSRGISPKN